MRRSTQGPKSPFSHDLHVLSTPPAFNLSQDQTLQFKSFFSVAFAVHPITRTFGRCVSNHPTRYLIVKDHGRLESFELVLLAAPSASSGRTAYPPEAFLSTGNFLRPEEVFFSKPRFPSGRSGGIRRWAAAVNTKL